jgi:hemoglobin/transferrin/lactoferrin receptor protein
MQLYPFTRVLLCGSALIAMPVSATAEQATQLDLITVTVMKIKQVLSDVAAGISVGTQKEKDLYGQKTVQQIIAPMPGVSASQNADDPATAINIRGLQDFGRVAVTIDGARQNFQRTGHNSNGMFYFEPEQMQQVTVTRGPVANVYGSGAIGGVASFDTLDGLSFLKQGENVAASEKLSYSTNGGNLMSSTTGAVRLGDYGAVLGNFVLRNNGNYVDGEGNLVGNSNSGNLLIGTAKDIKSGMGKVTLTPRDDTRLDLSYIVNNDKFQSAVGPSTSTTSARYDNDVTAQTLASKFSFAPKDNKLVDFNAGAYWTETEQAQTRLNGAYTGYHRSFKIDTLGTDIYNTSRFNTGSVGHSLTIGADVFKDTVANIDPTLGGGNFYTPSGERIAGGAFVQDKIEVNRWLEFIVAGRYDAYLLDGGSVSTSGSHFSPKGTVVLKPFEDSSLKGLNFYGTYAEGYRAPATTETLISGVHPSAPFTFLPNPNLRPEIGHTLEAGLTGKFDNVFRSDDRVTVRGAVYQNGVDNYIDLLNSDPLGNDPCGPPTYACYADDTSQYVNVANAKLHGIEAEIGYDSPFLFGGLAGSMIRGTNESTGDWLGSVPADKLVATLGFHFADQKGSIGARWFAVAAQDRVPPTATNASKAYNLVNLFANYTVNDNLNIGLNVDNLFNETYKSYLDAYNQPGRTVMLTVTTRFGK